MILDFFTYCCINCLHILPDLTALEERFKDDGGVVVVGVHSAKFDNEKLSANILSAVLRYNISHPVVNDTDAVMWQELMISCWPSLLILGPDNQLLIQIVGEGHGQLLLEFVTAAVEYFDTLGQLNHKSLDYLQLSKQCLPVTPLLFPGKCAVSKKGDRIVIADTGHHRIIVVSVDGVVLVSYTKKQTSNIDIKHTHIRIDTDTHACTDAHTLFYTQK